MAVTRLNACWANRLLSIVVKKLGKIPSLSYIPIPDICKQVVDVERVVDILFRFRPKTSHVSQPSQKCMSHDENEMGRYASNKRNDM